MIKATKKFKQEAENNIRKTKLGEYKNLCDYSLARRGKKRLTDGQMNNLFKKLRLRVTLTPKCNLWCFFCSNEGSSYKDKKCKEANIEQVIKLSEILIRNTQLRAIDFSGGEPTIHSDFITKKFRLIEWAKKFPKVRFSLHTNGINLTAEMIDKIKDIFSRIGISVHSFNFDIWNKVTNLNGIFPLAVQKHKFKRMMENLNYLSRQNIGNKVFIKSVVMKDINDDQKELKKFLDNCNKLRFHPKFLEFEPQYAGQEKYLINREAFINKLKRNGCKFNQQIPKNDNSNVYIPAITFNYKNSTMGLEGIFGCGTKSACSVCYDYLCMFVKSFENGDGLYLKPCSVLNTQIDLKQAIATNNYRQIFD